MPHKLRETAQLRKMRRLECSGVAQGGGEGATTWLMERWRLEGGDMVQGPARGPRRNSGRDGDWRAATTGGDLQKAPGHKES
jgi:hypothetical protein